MSIVNSITFSKIIYDLLSLRKGKLSDDEELDERQVKFWILNTREYLIRQDFGKNRTLSENVIQDLGCVELETSDRAECCALYSDCDIKRTKLEIPKPVEFTSFDGFTRIGPIDKIALPYSFITFNEAIFSGNGRFNKYQIFAFNHNNRIYLKFSPINMQAKALKYINIQGVFYNPEQAGIFKTCTGSPCYTDDSEFPISGWMIEYMKSNIIQVNFKTMLTVPGDNVNDASAISQPTNPVNQSTQINT